MPSLPTEKRRYLARDIISRRGASGCDGRKRGKRTFREEWILLERSKHLKLIIFFHFWILLSTFFLLWVTLKPSQNFTMSSTRMLHLQVYFSPRYSFSRPCTVVYCMFLRMRVHSQEHAPSTGAHDEIGKKARKNWVVQWALWDALVSWAHHSNGCTHQFSVRDEHPLRRRLRLSYSFLFSDNFQRRPWRNVYINHIYIESWLRPHGSPAIPSTVEWVSSQRSFPIYMINIE